MGPAISDATHEDRRAAHIVWRELSMARLHIAGLLVSLLFPSILSAQSPRTAPAAPAKPKAFDAVGQATAAPAMGALPSSNTSEKPALLFDVVSVKQSKSVSGSISVFAPIEGDQLTLKNMTLASIIAYAYNFQNEDFVAGLPPWAKTVRYDIDAKVAETDVAAFRKLNEAQHKLMVQAILADNFKLKSSRQPRDVSIYALVVANGGPRMKEVKPGDPHPNATKGADGIPIEGMSLSKTGPNQITGQEISMAILVQPLSGITGRQVVDKTGLTGTYDFTLKWSPDQGTAPMSRESETSASRTDSGPSIFTAVQEQLGLKLEARKSSMPVLVVDHIEQPSEN
jgi:uncharacterized protein (TIGR03435 family)